MIRLLVLTCSAFVALALPTAAAAKKTPEGFFGVVAQDQITNEDLINLADGRVDNVRAAVIWASVQFVPGQCQAKEQIGICNWTGLDGMFGSAALAGVRILPILTGPPSFVSKNPKNVPVKGQDARRWRAFLSALAARYGRGGFYWKQSKDYVPKPAPITDYQIWNEQNSKQGWQGRPNARKYAKFLKLSAKAIRKEDRKAEILLGGMFGEAKVPLTAYMRQLYRVKHIERSFDTIALHPYSPSLGDLRRQISKARGAAKRGGDGRAKIRLTELGWSSKNGRHPLMKGRKGQAKILGRAFRLLVRNRGKWNIDGVNWFALRDTDNPLTCAFCRDSGLFEISYEPKPSWREFKRFSK